MQRPEPVLDFRQLYDDFDAPVVAGVDCGKMCAPHNPSGKPFCCDICQAVPVASHQEWLYLQSSTDLWHAWRGDECSDDTNNPEEILRETPEHMLPLACLGPDRCQRPYRALSCRQFPFFPYITSSLEFIGLAYEWQFEQSCWVISSLGLVSGAYRQEFVRTYDRLFAQWHAEFNSYVRLSEDLREHFSSQRRRFPLLHRSGKLYLVSPLSERKQLVSAERLPRFRPYI